MQRWGVLFVVLAALVVGACGGGGSGGTSGGGGGGSISSLTITYGPSAPTASMRTESVTIPFTATQPAGSTTSWTLAASTSGAISVSNMSIQPTTVAAGQTQVSGTVTFTAVSGKGSIRITGTPNAGSNVSKLMTFTIADRGLRAEFTSSVIEVDQGGAAQISVRFYPEPNSLTGVAQVPIQLDPGLTAVQPTAYVPILAGNTDPIDMEYTVLASNGVPIGSNLSARIPFVQLVRNLIEGTSTVLAVQPPGPWGFYFIAEPPIITMKPNMWSGNVRFTLKAIGDPPLGSLLIPVPWLENSGFFVDPVNWIPFPIDWDPYFEQQISKDFKFRYVPGNIQFPHLFAITAKFRYKGISHDYTTNVLIQLDQS